ncbi:O-methyltransferase [Aeromicrobium endophyticum]|uniref:SAM-dependent methyltransferase n=1 Tax=Aeromicrobium endophyticum TaxID=2292704 RepID=A0A371PBB8_9ACTN|nr:class I SAM-dependent methyltransferase [Aeromicrobium endophyticum]REK72760.1 SAM-dependent methyltransferase [Aeromicrobium endophyticum]
MTDAVVSSPRPVTPTTILARELAEVAELIGPSVEPELAERLRRVTALAAGLDPYVAACTSPESPALAEVARRTQEAPWASREVVSGSGPLEQEMLSGHVEGRFLAFLVRMLKARRVLEIGMFTGYSALAMAEALPPGGEVVACEVDPYVAGLAFDWLSRSTAGATVMIEVGPALETLERLDGPFDLVFIDADKTGYLDYYRFLLASDLLADGGVIAVDNTLLQGQPWAADPTVNGAAVAEFNQVVADDPRVEQVLVPLRDGVTLIRRT